jgi:hypothetical protein
MNRFGRIGIKFTVERFKFQVSSFKFQVFEHFTIHNSQFTIKK